MASASKTPNLNLPQWVATEKPEMVDFNGAFNTIDGNIDNLNKVGYLPWLNFEGLDILSAALSSVSAQQIRWFTTGQNTTNLPNTATTWKYAMGYVFRPVPARVKIVLFGGITNDVAYNTHTGGAWIGWEIK